MAFALACTTAVFGDVVLDWNAVTLDAIRTDRTAPPEAARTLAMVQVAVFDAVNAIRGGYEPYLPGDFAARGDESPEAAAITSAYSVLSAVYPAQQATFDAARDASLATITDSRSKDRGIELGERVAAAMLRARSDDGSATTVN